MATRKTSRSSAVELDASMRVVILRGPDQYLRTAYTQRLVEALVAEHGEIEQFAFDGASVEPAVILDELRSYGLMQQHKLVIVDGADQLLASAKDDDGGGRGHKSSRELLERYAEAPVDSATLLLRAETWRPGRLDKVVQKTGAIVKCDAPDARRAASWCVGRTTKEYDATISTQAAGMIVDRIGPELARLDVELAKLASYVGPGGTIEPEHVRLLVGLSREEKAWEIQSALLTGRPAQAVEKLRELLDVSRQPRELIAWSMVDLLRKLHAAARLLTQGEQPGDIARRLKLWGPARDGVLKAARTVDPAALAQLLRASVQTDAGLKRGLGSGPRSLEALAVRIADTMKCA